MRVVAGNVCRTKGRLFSNTAGHFRMVSIEDARNHTNMGRIISEYKRHKDALVQFEQALQIWNGHGLTKDHYEVAKLHADIGMSLRGLSRHEEASKAEEIAGRLLRMI